MYGVKVHFLIGEFLALSQDNILVMEYIRRSTPANYLILVFTQQSLERDIQNPVYKGHYN